MNFRIIILKTLLTIAPPGNTHFSVTVDDCHKDNCDGKTYSSFYGQYVHQETYEEGKVRYEGIVDAEIQAAEAELCIDSEGAKIPECKPNAKAKGWTVKELLAVTDGLAIAESGLREDVEVGRGFSSLTHNKQPKDDAGGEGRGPAGEVCLMQILPQNIPKFSPDGNGSPDSLLGSNHEHLVRCFRTGMRMLIQSRSYCDWVMNKKLKEYLKTGQNPAAFPYDSYYGMFSMYGTGSSCSSFNHNKTSMRTSITYRFIRVAKEMGQLRK